MGLFDFFRRKKKVVERKARARDPKLKIAFEKVKTDIEEIKSELKNHSELISEHSEIINVLKPLPNQVKELQKQFTELIMNSVNSPSTSLTVHQKSSELSELTEPALESLTPHTKQAFGIILRLLNEYGEEWLPVSELTRELYPEKEAKEIRNAVSNTLKSLLTSGLIERKREGNYVFIKLTEKGFKVSQTELSKIQLKKLAKYYKK